MERIREIRLCQECWGREAVNAEDHTTFCDGEEPAFEGKQDTHREREMGTKSMFLFIKYATVTK